MQCRYQILKQDECCEVRGKCFNDFNLAISFMRSAPWSTYLLDKEKGEIVAEYTK